MKLYRITVPIKRQLDHIRTYEAVNQVFTEDTRLGRFVKENDIRFSYNYMTMVPGTDMTLVSFNLDLTKENHLLLRIMGYNFTEATPLARGSIHEEI